MKIYFSTDHLFYEYFIMHIKIKICLKEILQAKTAN